MDNIRSRSRYACLSLGFIALGLCAYPVHGQICISPTNAIVAENCLPGNPSSEWNITGVGSNSIQGFATDISVNRGSTIQFKIRSTTATAYRLDIYRSGYYGGAGARKVASILPSVSLPQTQPNCLTNAVSGLIDCGNWAVSASWNVPATAVSGVYFAKLVATAGITGSSHIIFIVRDDTGGSDILFQTPDTTWQAYNDYGGNSLYTGSPAGRAYKVSYNRPFATRGVDSGQDFYFANEYPMVRWLESNGYNVSYSTDVDTDRRGAEILEHKVFLSVGHDEYWSGVQRANVEYARDHGVHLAFFSGNEVFWKTRWEASIDASGTAYRTLVCYKETHAGAKLDPTSTWTGTWRDPRFSPPSDGGRPENALTGTIFMVNGTSQPITISEPEGKSRFWRNTSFAQLSPGTSATTNAGLIGYESDDAPNNGATPAGLVRLSTSVFSLPSAYLLDYGSTYGAGVSTHSLVLHREPSGALVFGAGTIRWSWGLDATHDIAGLAADPRVQQATINLFADMGVQPATIRSGMVQATASSDLTAPVSTITSPLTGAQISQGVAITVTGTASDVGGRLAAVEVSVDGGTTWRAATGTTSWTFSWSPSALGTFALKSRGIDDSLNIETPATSASVTVLGRTCPCTIWGPSTVPGVSSDPDPSAVELGVKFSSSQNGTITGVRFYKGSANTGTHTGKLWSNSGSLLATVTFTNETASGWQQATFSTPVAITAGVTYVASYWAPNGRYAADSFGLSTAVDSTPLRALSSVESGGNGVYRYASTGFPNSTWSATNYWVDVVFMPTSTDTTGPIVSSVSATPSSSSALITWTTDENASSLVRYGTSAASLNLSASDATLVKSHSLNLTGLTAGTYYFRVTSMDGSANSTTSPVAPATLSFIVVDNVPPVISGVVAAPGSSTASISWTTDEPSTTVVNYGTSAATLNVNLSSSTLSLVHTLSITGLTPGATYFYRVTSVDASTNSSTSPALVNQPASFITTVPLPPVISNIAVAPGANGAVISWTTDKLANSRVDYGTDPNVLGTGLTDPTMTTAHSISLTGLIQGATYYFRITAVDANTLSTISPNPPAIPLSFITTTVPAPVLSAVVVTPGLDGVAKITWTTNTIATSVVQYGTSASALNLSSSDSAMVTAHVINLTGLGYGTTYYYRVTSVNTGGASATAPAIPAVPATFLENLISLFPTTALPAVPADPTDASAVVLGMKFQSDVAGKITAIRFYKGSTNTGSHTARIWSSTGTSLASVTFAGENAAGWQQQNLTTPLAITANTVYVVSYRAPAGRYAIDVGYFTNGVDRGPLHSPSNAAAGGNGVYIYGAASLFPNQTWQSSNYWVDIVFTPNP